MGEESVILRYVAAPAALRGQDNAARAIEPYLITAGHAAALWGLGSGDHLQDRGLAGTRWTCQRQALARGDMERDVELHVADRPGELSVQHCRERPCLQRI